MYRATDGATLPPKLGFMSDIGAAVRNARKERGWTQAELAKLAGVDIKTVGRLERGEVENPAKSGQVQKVLQIGIYATEPDYRPRHDPRLSEATFTELLAEFLERWNERNNQPAADTRDGVRFRGRDALPQHVQRALEEERRAAQLGKPSGGNTGG